MTFVCMYIVCMYVYECVVIEVELICIISYFLETDFAKQLLKVVVKSATVHQSLKLMGWVLGNNNELKPEKIYTNIKFMCKQISFVTRQILLNINNPAHCNKYLYIEYTVFPP